MSCIFSVCLVSGGWSCVDMGQCISVLQPARGLDVAPVLSWLEAGHHQRGCRGHQRLLLLLCLWQPHWGQWRVSLVHLLRPLESTITLVRGQTGAEVSARGPRVFYRGYPWVWTQPVLTPSADSRLRPGTGGGDWPLTSSLSWPEEDRLSVRSLVTPGSSEMKFTIFIWFNLFGLESLRLLFHSVFPNITNERVVLSGEGHLALLTPSPRPDHPGHPHRPHGPDGLGEVQPLPSASALQIIAGPENHETS